ncbi:MAG: DUF456 domain-containing protein [Flavobacteriaceae bacterium]|nr:DUF456 domain-containing protein [Flavobacteriaceae bacterium]
MDTFLIIVGFLLTLLGIAGSFLPVLPGPITGWLGLLLLHLTNAVPMSYTFLGITFVISIIIWVLDYVIPAMGTKKFGGTKYGAIGTTIGLIIGLIAPIPLGFIIGAFLGALIGELIHDAGDFNKAIKGAFGSFLGFLASTGLKFVVAFIFAGLFVYKIITYWDNFF